MGKHGQICPLFLILLPLAAPIAAQAQFSYATNAEAITLSGYSGPGGAVTIPSAIKGLRVTDIGRNAFYNCTKLTSVSIPSSVTNIGAFAFKNCTSLTNATIPDSVTSIREAAFESCTGLASITIPGSVTSMGELTFSGCTGLTNATMADGLTTI